MMLLSMMWLYCSDTYMPLLTMIVYLVLWSRIAKKELLLFCYLLFNTVLFAITNVMADKGANNLFLYHFYSLFEFAALTWYILRSLLRKNLIVVGSIIIGYAVLWGLNIVFYESLDMYNSNSLTLGGFLLLLQSMYYMLQLSKSDEILYFQRLPTFWIVSGFLVSYAISTLAVLTYKWYVAPDDNKEANRIWIIVSVANIVKFGLIIIGLICYKRPKQFTRQPLLL